MKVKCPKCGADLVRYAVDGGKNWCVYHCSDCDKRYEPQEVKNFRSMNWKTQIWFCIIVLIIASFFIGYGIGYQSAEKYSREKQDRMQNLVQEYHNKNQKLDAEYKTLAKEASTIAFKYLELCNKIDEVLKKSRMKSLEEQSLLYKQSW